MGGVTMYKIKIFISSTVDENGENKFSEMRRKITNELEKTELFNVYIYEKGYSTSKNVVNDYLDEIFDSHVCLFLIDSAEGAPDGVQKEINYSNKLNKPQIYIFNRADAQEETPLEKELKTPQGSRIKKINKFDEFYNESIGSIKSEIVKIYKDYSSGNLVRNKREKESSIDLKLSLTETDLKKSYIKGFNETRKHICLFLGTEDRSYDEQSSNNLDVHTKSFFDVLIRKKEISEFNATFYLDELKEWHQEEVHEVIKFRWKAIEYYFSGDLEKCIENLEIAYKKATMNNLAPWLIQDILIDLRNKVAVRYSDQNGYEKEPVYQGILTKTEAVLTYPVIDRLNKQLLERIDKKRKDNFFKKAHSVTYDNILSEFSGMITSIYVVATHYGSLTHLEIIIKNLQDIYYYLAESYSDWEFKVMLLKMTIYLTNKKDLERILRKYNNILSQINSRDVEDILSFSSKHPHKITNKKNVLLALSYLGYYLEDDGYDKYKVQIDHGFNEWLKDPNKNISLGIYYFKYDKENCARLNQNKLVKYANIVFLGPMNRFYNEVLEVLKVVDFSEVNNQEIEKLIKNMSQLLIEDKLDRFQYLRIIFVEIYKTSIFKDEIDELSKDYLPEIENDLYFVEVDKDQVSPNQAYLNSIKALKDSEREAAIGTSYSYYGYNHFSIIKSTLGRIENITEDNVHKLLDLLAKIIINDNQEPDAKVNAFQLMIYLKNNDIRFSNMKSYYEEIIKNDHNVLNVRDAFVFNHSSLVISFNYLLFKSLFSDRSVQLEYQFISEINYAGITDRLGFSKAIRNYLFGNKSEISTLVIHLLFILKSAEDEQVRVNSLLGLIYLISNQENENILIEISKMMDTETTLIKNVILRNIDIIKAIDPNIAQHILQKGRIDSHYLIRKQVATKTNS